MKTYQIELRQKPLSCKIHRENYNSDDEFSDALAQSDGKIFLEIDISDGEQGKRIHTPIVEDAKWEHALRMSLDVIKQCIVKHEARCVDLLDAEIKA